MPRKRYYEIPITYDQRVRPDLGSQMQTPHPLIIPHPQITPIPQQLINTIDIPPKNSIMQGSVALPIPDVYPLGLVFDCIEEVDIDEGF